MGTEENAVEESLIGGMGCVSADDVNDGFGEADCRSAGLPGKGRFEIFTGEFSSERLKFACHGKKKVDTIGGVHDERAWSMVREHPLGSAPGSRPIRVKDPS